jgi:hypothetical protein
LRVSRRLEDRWEYCRGFSGRINGELEDKSGRFWWKFDGISRKLVGNSKKLAVFLGFLSNFHAIPEF